MSTTTESVSRPRRHARHWRLEKVCRRNSDGSLWRASFPEWWGNGDAIAAAFSGEDNFYFRRIKRVKRWWLWGYWVDTGDVWEPASGEFEVFDQKEILSSDPDASRGARMALHHEPRGSW